MGKLIDRMTPSAARIHLLAQHAQIRVLLATATAEAELVRHGAPPEEDFAEAVSVLVSALMAHNSAEETALAPLLREADAWGPLRVERMMEVHRAEHAIFIDALTEDLDDLARAIDEIAEDLDAHMEAEERSFLSPAVLRDDVVSHLGLSS